MPKKPEPQNEIHYYSDRLKKKLARMKTARTAIVEAPSGYGKTTAVRDWLSDTVPRSMPVCWFTATDELPAACFGRFAQALSKIDDRACERLLKTGLPNAATLGEACDAVRSIKCEFDTWFIVDNAQYMLPVLPPSFFKALVEHGGEKLHLVLLTKMLGRTALAAVKGSGILHITASDLRLDAGDVLRYFALAGIQTSQETAEKIERYTGGWVIAVYLQLKVYKEHGGIGDTRDITALMEHLLWNCLSGEQQDFFLRLTPFESATVRQICTLFGFDALPEYVLDALNNPFMYYDPIEKRYAPHSILYELARQKFRERENDFKRECYLQAGDLCRGEDRVLEALGFYWRIRDCGRFLSVDFSPFILEDIGDAPFYTVALQLSKCPADLKEQYPLSMLRVAWALKTHGFDAEFDTLLNELRPIVKSRMDEPELYGEWLLLSSFQCHPDLTGMAAMLQKAEPFFAGKCSRVILPAALWGFSVWGPLALYYVQPGGADRAAEVLAGYLSVYSRLTNGGGSGGDALYRAELSYHRGDLSDAEIYAYKAMYLAQSKQQSIVQMSAVLQLAQVALHKADTAGWQNAVDSMKHAAAPAQDAFAFRAALDIMRGMLFAELAQLDGIADWLKEGNFSKPRLLPALVPLAVFVHANFLMHKGQFTRLVGLIEARYPDGVSDSPLVSMLLSLTAAVGYLQTGSRARAQTCIQRAASQTLPDGVIFPFASYAWSLDGMVDALIEKEYPALMGRFLEIKERFAAGWIKLYGDLRPEELPDALTEREREVASLAAQGLRNSEIASMLNVSENTVRAHLRTAFSKLNVDRRAKLAEKLK